MHWIMAFWTLRIELRMHVENKPENMASHKKCMYTSTETCYIYGRIYMRWFIHTAVVYVYINKHLLHIQPFLHEMGDIYHCKYICISKRDGSFIKPYVYATEECAMSQVGASTSGCASFKILKWQDPGQVVITRWSPNSGKRAWLVVCYICAVQE